MSDPAGASAVAAAVADAHRREWAFVLAATVRVTRDLDVAEECVQEAFAAALTDWRRSGVPTRPGAWLTTAARRRALNVVRHRGVESRYLPLLVEEETLPGPGDALDDEGAPIPDDRLRLVVTCCHPALDRPAQVALTLRLLCGLSTAEVARAFLVSEPTMAARITRAKKKIAVARIPYRVPPAAELPERVDAVLSVVHLLFTTGHTTPVGDELVRRDLVERSVELCRMLRRLLPRDPAVAGLLALLLLTDARRETRTAPDGRLLLLEEQDRARWDRAAIAEGVSLVREALRARPPSRYALQAAIAAVHAESPRWEDTDWREVVALYDVLVRLWPSPVVALNRAVAVGFASGPAAGLAALDALSAEPQLAGYGYLPAARADLLRRLGRVAEAREAYTEALLLTQNAVERAFLEGRLRGTGG
ncbi:RNA polymerase sigma-70 factor (ECF subfamily) [Geodermatophilus bullaregiensis]|uniref:RNA polymerase sigma factor n=1 Tax=Geodermatophilus bullaregiensis TaxID=1564160 RepID=UPI00195EDB10|nr:sigma-70 family RNA polymerase sigma factor [Geodermatophilus bullaregiensis]MBM7808941.1 RNA polymerase sigma-70 factor (ECF subfamily) [Geodermatophilus bullaregiensis]